MLFFLTARWRMVAAMAAMSVPALAQAMAPVSVAGYGYRKPANSIVAAPGQTMTVSVFGALVRLQAPELPVAGGNGYPTEVRGISADFVQGPTTIALPIRVLQQSPCPSFGGCSPSTTITTQIPFELAPTPANPAKLRVKEGGVAISEIAIQAVTDSVHVINSCDETGIFLSLAHGLPANLCAPMVMHARGPLVSASAPAKPGETLIVWAYGLGALTNPMPGSCCSEPSQVPVVAHPFTASFSYSNTQRQPLRRMGRPAAPSYAGMIGGGLYQVHVTVPEAPQDLGPCLGTRGNVQVTISGPASADAAEFCVQP